jgi:hypothetical protein
VRGGEGSLGRGRVLSVHLRSWKAWLLGGPCAIPVVHVHGGMGSEESKKMIHDTLGLFFFESLICRHAGEGEIGAFW